MKLKRVPVYLILLAIAIGLGAFNYYLWQLQVDKKQDISGLQSQVRLHEEENRQLRARNRGKAEEVKTLRSPESFYIHEERARKEYGMIGSNETYFMLADEETADIEDIEGLAAIEESGQGVVNTGDSPPLPMEIADDIIRLESVPEAAPLPETDASVLEELSDPPLLQLESLQ